MNLNTNTLFEQLYKHFSEFQNKDIIANEICYIEEFVEDDGYLFEQLKTQLPEIEQDYISKQSNLKYTTQIFQQLAQLLNTDSNKNDTISCIKQKSNNKLSLFTELTTFISGATDQKQISVDAYISKQYRLLYSLEIISIKSKISISEYLMTGYHNSGLCLNEYIANNELFKQLQYSKTVAKHIAYTTMKNYMIAYDRLICKPLPFANQKLSIDKYNDNINVISQYMIEINNGLNKVLSRKTSYPIQLDVFFVAPNTHKQLNLHALGGLEGVKSDMDSRKNAAGVSDIYRIIRAASLDINKCHGQRFIMLIVRGNEDDSINDTIYVFKPNINNLIIDKHVSDYVELMYLLNSKSMIIPGLMPDDMGVLGFTHHLHAIDCNKVYISYGNYKSRVFKNNILDKLKYLFNWHNDKRHIIGENTKIDFINNYYDLDDVFYTEIGEYWFNNNRSYECFEPIWDSNKCVSDNLCIPNDKIFHDAVKDYIDKTIECKTNNIFNEMYIIDSQTTYIQFPNNKNGICFIKTTLCKNEEPLFIVAEPNMNSNKLWKIIDYRHISDVFMNIEQLINKFGIFGIDLPKTIPQKIEKQTLNPDAQVFTPGIPMTTPQMNCSNSLPSITEIKNNDAEVAEQKSNRIIAKPIANNNLRPAMPHPKQSQSLPIYFQEPSLPIYPMTINCYGNMPILINNNTEQIHKQHMNMNTNTISKTLFVPNYPARARLNIFIDKELTAQLSTMICEPFKDTKTLYYYMDISTALQINDKQMNIYNINGYQTVFVNYDLHSHNNNILYGVIGLNDNTQHIDNGNNDKTKWKWKLYHFLTAEQIYNKYGIYCNELPKSSRKMDGFVKQLNMPRSVLNNMNSNIIENTNWLNIEQIKSAKKNKNKNKRTCRLNIRQWINQCKNSWNNIEAIPIVIIDKNIGVYKHWIEWVKIVRFNRNKNIAVSCKYMNNQWEITSVILDKGDILNKHTLIGDVLNQYDQQMYFKCLSCFNTAFTRIQWKQ